MDAVRFSLLCFSSIFLCAASGPDPFFQSQWALRDIEASSDLWEPLEAPLIAVIDTGVDDAHPELHDAIWVNPGEAGAKSNNGLDDDQNGFIDDVSGWDFVENHNHPSDRFVEYTQGHGTQVAGVIAAKENNALGIAGVFPRAKILPVRFIDEVGFGSTENAIKAIRYALQQGARILNISWGGRESGVANSQSLLEAFKEAEREGALVIVAAGNGGIDLDRFPEKSIPASYNLENFITVAASGPGGYRAIFSNYGAEIVHLAAPGIGILTTAPGRKFAYVDGSSMAVPHVSAAAAYLWARHPTWNAKQVKNELLKNVTLTESLREKVKTAGRLLIKNLR